MGIMKTMDYKEFKEYVRDNIFMHLPDRYTGGTASLSRIQKTGGRVQDNLSIRLPGSDISPNIYLEDYYSSYACGRPLNKIMNDIAVFRTDHEGLESVGLDPGVCSPRKLMDYSKMRGRIIPRLINYKANRVYLQDKAFRLVEDLAVCYHVLFDAGNVHYTTAVTRDMLLAYDVSTDELHETAVENQRHLVPVWFRSLDTLVAETMMEAAGPDSSPSQFGFPMTSDGLIDDNGIMVVSNALRCYGASFILDPLIMEVFLRTIGQDLYILPSSVHEVLLIPGDLPKDVKSMQDMVREINRTEVAREDRLSDSVYTYDHETHLPVICKD